jgi:hypothetical protein
VGDLNSLNVLNVVFASPGSRLLMAAGTFDCAIQVENDGCAIGSNRQTVLASINPKSYYFSWTVWPTATLSGARANRS